MAIPLIPIIYALMAGGTLVPHAAGGMIVTSAAGYIAGTYLSTSAIASLLTTAGAGTGLALVGTTLKGVFGKTLARTATVPVATGVAATTEGAAAGVASVLGSPALVAVTTGVAVLGLGYSVYRLYNLKRKVDSVPEGEEAQFTETEAKTVPKIIKRLAKKEGSKAR